MASRASKKAKREKRKKKIAHEVQTKVTRRLLGRKRIDRAEQAVMMLSHATRGLLQGAHASESKQLDLYEVVLILAKQALGKELSSEDFECLDDFVNPPIAPPAEKPEAEAAPAVEETAPVVEQVEERDPWLDEPLTAEETAAIVAAAQDDTEEIPF